MPHILRIDTSSRPNSVSKDESGSHSRELADVVIEKFKSEHSDVTITLRDLVQTPPPHLANDTIAGFFTEPQDRSPEVADAIKLSDELITELKAADILVISMPMYNFGTPSNFKAWIDQITRIGETFNFTDEGFEGLIHGKKAILCTSYGAAGFMPGGDYEAVNFMVNYTKHILGFIGITDFQLFGVEATNMDVEGLPAQKEKVNADVDKFVKSIA